MVSLVALWQLSSYAAAPLAWAEAEGQPLLTRLSPQNRAIVLMALLGLVLVGIALVALAILGGRHVLREARRSHGPTPRYEDGWYRKPLIERESDSPGDGPS
jgi:hypothetical protein